MKKKELKGLSKRCPVGLTNALIEVLQHCIASNMFYVIISDDRVAVFAKFIGQKYVWDNGVTVDSTKYCTGNPDAPGANMCLYMEDIAGTWCGSATNRLDDGPCSTESLRICMIKL